MKGRLLAVSLVMSLLMGQTAYAQDYEYVPETVIEDAVSSEIMTTSIEETELEIVTEAVTETETAKAEYLMSETNGSYSYTENGIIYSITEGSAIVTGYTGEPVDVIIPEKVKEAVVEIIGMDAFNDCSTLKSVVLPNTIIHIDDHAFYHCIELAEINLPDSLNTIGSYAFFDCDSLTSVIFPENLKSIASGAFSSCYNLNGNIDIPEGITAIESYTFAQSNIQSVSLPSTLTNIETAAFSGCRLTSIVIPDKVTSISDRAFEGANLSEGVVLPEGVEAIGNYAFAYCNMEDIVLPDSLTHIGDGAFEQCSKLEAIDIPEAVTELGDYAFFRCTSLNNVKISPKLMELINRANVFGDTPWLLNSYDVILDSANENGKGAIEVKWHQAEGFNGYKIYRKTINSE